MTLRSRLAIAALLLLAQFTVIAAPARDVPDSIRLYTLDCGRIEFKDLAAFADDDSYNGQPGTMAAPCFLIVHPKGTLLWETGLGDALATKLNGAAIEGMGIRFLVPTTLQSQLARVGFEPSQIDYVGLSHLHVDHVGNLALFARSTILLGAGELDWALQTPAPAGVDPSLIAMTRSAAVRTVAGDEDVFGDGSVRILKAPGHTPGHRVLLLTLRHAGTIVLSGDLWHTRANYEQSRVPTFNTSRSDSLASFDRIHKILEKRHARLIIQHDARDLATLPRFPAYLD